MFTPENAGILGLMVMISLLVAVGYNQFRPGSIVTREENLEQEVKRLTRQVEALQETIDVLSSRIKHLQDENDRLRNELGRVIPHGNWRATETSLVRNALEKLSVEELRQLAFERFRPVFDGFGSDQSLQAQRLALMEYAENHAQLDALRAAIAEINPAAFWSRRRGDTVGYDRPAGVGDRVDRSA